VFLCKNPGDGAFAAWHQDGVYSGWYLTPSVSAWVALSDSTIENGCMRVVPGSHRSGRFEHRPFAGENSLFLRTEEVQVEVDEASARNVELRAGEFSLHDSNIIHGSKPNVSDTRRIGFVIRYVTPAFQRRRGNHPLVRVRGRADVAHVPLLETAPSGDAGESFARWRSA
jgi:ectoine hydroxylase-related dioxygenase (phytanoyl-CoA dioxygenase family)